MQGPLVRDVLLVAIGNSLIAGKSVGWFWPDSGIFRYSRECVFVDRDHSVTAADPNTWLERVRTFDGLWLDYTDRGKWVGDRMTVGFVGGGHRWLIGAVNGSVTEIWEGHDTLGDRNATDGKIWTTHYVRLDADWKETRTRGRSVGELKTALDGTLAKIEAFARQQKLADFAGDFGAARKALTARPRADPMLVDAMLPEDAAQLWAAIGAAWVFGGMGSWNDMSFDGEDGKTYEALSDQLFGELNEAVAAVANSTWPSHSHP